MLTVLRILSAALVLTFAAFVVGWLILDEDNGPPTIYVAQELSSYDSTTVAITRADFCDRFVEQAVTDAVGGEPTEEASYGNGEQAVVAPGVNDVAHEYGCLFRGEAGVEARAWVFAPPVTGERAAALAKAAQQTPGCTPATDAPAYGAPTVALVCEGKKGQTASYRGLFGDAWLACGLSAPRDLAQPALLEAAGEWCVAVAEAARTSE